MIELISTEKSRNLIKQGVLDINQYQSQTNLKPLIVLNPGSIFKM